MTHCSVVGRRGGVVGVLLCRAIRSDNGSFLKSSVVQSVGGGSR